MTDAVEGHGPGSGAGPGTGTDMEETARAVHDLVRQYGRTFAEEAGIDLRDEPGPLWQLLVLTLLLSARIRSAVAVATARELFAAGWTTPAAMRAASRSAVVSALGRGGYRRYDFSTATKLAQGAALIQERWGDDLRMLRDEVQGRPDDVARLLTTFPGIGPAGTRIFLREVQAVWPHVRPALDDLALTGARSLGLPTDPDALAALVPADDVARLAAALVRVARRPRRRSGDIGQGMSLDSQRRGAPNTR